MPVSPTLSVIVPVLDEAENIPVFLAAMLAQLQKLTPAYEVIFVMDPSTDGTEASILDARRDDDRIKLLKFSRRFGQPMATLAGLQYSRGDAVVVIDVDLQDPPDLLPQMVAKWREGFDVVLPQRERRNGEPWIKRLIAKLGYRVINRIADVEITPDTGDFRLMSRRVVEELLRLKECHGFLRGMVAFVGFRQATIPFQRPPRSIGRSKYNRFFGSLRIGFNGVFCFSNYALTLATKLGFVIAGFSFLLTVVYLFLKLIDYPIVWGNPTMVILISFLGGVQLIGIGILGEYIGRIYEEVRSRPKFIVETAVGFEETKRL